MLDAHRLEEFYTAVGAAVWHLQFLEDMLVTYVTARLKLPRPGVGESGMDVLAAQRRRTLGALMNDAESGGLLLDRVEEAFEVLEERNWLVHRSMHEINDSLYADAHFDLAVARVRKIESDSIALKKALYGEFRDWLKAQGINVVAAEAAGFARYREIHDA